MNKLFSMYIEGFKLQYEQIIVGFEAIEEEGDWNVDVYGNMSTYYENDLVSIIVRVCSVDRSISIKEVELINELFDTNYDTRDISSIIGCENEDIETFLDENIENDMRNLKRLNNDLYNEFIQLIDTMVKIMTVSDGVLQLDEMEIVKRWNEKLKNDNIQKGL